MGIVECYNEMAVLRFENKVGMFSNCSEFLRYLRLNGFNDSVMQ